jgi:5-methylcytosine-specific restriction enzyme subunit McrC
MRHLVLNEWTSADVELTAQEALDLRTSPADVAVAPIGHGIYRVTPSHFVGSVRLGQLSLIVRPKVELDRLFFLLGYTRTLDFDQTATVELKVQPYLTEAFIRVFLDEVQRALRRGALMLYMTVDDSGNTVRGRLRVADQLRRRYAIPLPVEITYDDFTVDIAENRILRAALRRASRLRLTNPSLRRRVVTALGALEGVTDVAYSARSVPDVRLTRINRHYMGALALARALIASTSVDLDHGTTRTPAFVVDMDKVFEDFLARSLEDALATSGCRWKQGAARRLDVAGRVTIKPDLSLWKGRRCIFVGDAKYKQTAQGENADLYQMLAYCKALGLNAGLLVYAVTDEEVIEHEILRDGTRIVVRSLDLRGTDEDIMRRIDELAAVIDEMAANALAAAA